MIKTKQHRRQELINKQLKKLCSQKKRHPQNHSHHTNLRSRILRHHLANLQVRTHLIGDRIHPVGS